MDRDLGAYLRPGKYVDSDSPQVIEKSREITCGCSTDVEKAIKIHQYVRDLPFDIGYGFRMLLAGQDKASDFLREGRGFCMHKALAFVALCRASQIPARISFEIVESHDKPFHPEKIRKMYGQRPQPWHSSGEVYLNGKWIKADCTVDKEQGKKYGKVVMDFDGIRPLPTAEGPILKERGNSPDMPEGVVNRHRKAAATFFRYMETSEELPELPNGIIEGEGLDIVLNPPGG
jgi:transglutaminase-like putative cysteine protease